MPPTLVPRPAWLAVRLAPCGHELALSLLGAGLLIGALTDNLAAPESFYVALADATDPLHELRLTYTAMAEHYDYLLDTVAPILHWAEDATSFTDDVVRRAARVLANVDFAETAMFAGGDLLGQVKVELDIQRTRHRPVLEYMDLETATCEALRDRDRLTEDGGMLDGWCASGVRVMGIVQAMRMLGREPKTCRFYLRDPDPTNLAIAAINLASMGIPHCAFEHAAGIAHGDFSQQIRTTDEAIEAGMFEAPNHTGAQFVDDMVKATMAADIANFVDQYDRDCEAVSDVLLAAQHGPEALDAKEAMRNRRR